MTECPRDAMQGIHEFISTEKKVRYINALLKCGFGTIDFGSFVSPKVIPQMRDTAEVLVKLDLSGTRSKLLAIVANVRGAEEAVKYDQVDCLGYPFSVSETFQQRNTNASMDESLLRVEEMQELCVRHNKTLVVYLSMAFGNPYGDPWSAEIVMNRAKQLTEMGIMTIALADTIGISNPENIHYLFSNLIPALPQAILGAHLHTTPNTWKEKMEAAWMAGCRSFDHAVKGYGGCPMAADELTGNMPTEKVLEFLAGKGIDTGINKPAFDEAMLLAGQTFS
ncbi:MAG TPA: hydroxymethylglutaryl-CoA lyase [Bacteroidia bacterium]|nr:hydroxymethylglutaryl-CoA lyase [Bacteroidia bacterium]